MNTSENVYIALYDAMSRAVRHGVNLGTHDFGVFNTNGVYRSTPASYAKCCAIGCYLIDTNYYSGDLLRDAAMGLSIEINAVAMITRGFDLGPGLSEDEFFLVGARLRIEFQVF